MSRTDVPRLVAFAVGVWLMFAPAVLGYDGRAEANDRIVGPLVASLAFVALWELGQALRWITLPMGVWLVLAPVALWYPDAEASVNSTVCGLLVAAAASLGHRTSASFANGWRGVVDPP